MNNKIKVIIKFVALALMIVSTVMMSYYCLTGIEVISDIDKVQSVTNLKDLLDTYPTSTSGTTVQVDLSSLTYGDITSSIFEEGSLYITKDMFSVVISFIFVLVLISHVAILFLKSIWRDLKPKGTSKAASTTVDNCNSTVITKIK